jgi:hypothetical protein
VSSVAPPASPTASVRPPASATSGGTGAWAESFGSRWKLDLAVMALIVFCFGAVRPLSDPDLPMHLSVGEWIVRHGRVPFIEPFAWTRRGAPYYAYSWLPQTTFYLVLDTFGHLGLRALQGILVLASAASAVVFARAAGLRPSQAIMVAGFNLIVAAFFVALLRPQSILLITVPLVWVGFLWVAQGRHSKLALLVLFLTSAITANSHLFFPLTLAPAALLLVYRPARRRDGALAVGSVVAGWLATPYGLYWFDVFRHNFGPNYLFRPPSAITELQPGFVSVLYPAPTPMLALVGAMLAIPWALAGAPLRRNERLLGALYWTVGVILFGYATRLFVAWWLLAILPAAWAVKHLTGSTDDAPPRLRFQLLGLVACALIIATEASRTRTLWAMEGNTTTRTLPTFAARPAARLADWLATNAIPGARAKLMTTFAFGSYLTWRLPGYSASIDSRGVFPDSVAAAEAVVGAADRDVPLGPWRSADVAVLPLRYRAAVALDTAAGWRRMATVPGDPIRLDSAAVWVNLAWWSRNARAAARP